MTRWFRFYGDALNDPKVQSLPGELFKTWVNLLCVASKHDGKLPVNGELAYLLRRRSDHLQRDINTLVERGLLDLVGDQMEPHNWPERQYKSDVSAPRVRLHRERKRNVTHTVTETPPDNRVQNTESDKKESISSRALTRADKPKDEGPQKELEAVLDVEHAAAVVDHRRKLRKPLTTYAAKQLAKKFGAISNPNDGADAMIANGWQGFEPDWMRGSNGQRNGANHHQPRALTGASAQLAGAANLAQRMRGNIENRERDELFSTGTGDGKR